MRPDQLSRERIVQMLENRSPDEVVDLIWFLENSRQSWKRLAYELKDANESLMNWDGEIAAWKRR